MGKPIKIITHHTAVSGGDLPQLNAVNVYHKSLDFPKSSLGWHVGYTYFLEKSGLVTQTRTDTEEQSHTKGCNFDSIGICLAGNFDSERPTEAQLLSLKQLLLKKMTEYAIIPSNIFGHRIYAPKTCPGNLFPESELRSLFQPNTTYYQNLLNSLKDWLTKVKVGRVGSASSGCIDKNSRN